MENKVQRGVLYNRIYPQEKKKKVFARHLSYGPTPLDTTCCLQCRLFMYVEYAAYLLTFG